jgi:vacuolar-type H+-ATPase subunit E/Vma4
MAVEREVTTHEGITQTQETAQIVAAAVREAAQATAQAVREAATAAATIKENESTSALTAIALLQQKMATLECQIEKFDGVFKELFAKLDEINKGRLPWTVTAIISILTTACGILATVAVLR